MTRNSVQMFVEILRLGGRGFAEEKSDGVDLTPENVRIIRALRGLNY